MIPRWEGTVLAESLPWPQSVTDSIAHVAARGVPQEPPRASAALVISIAETSMFAAIGELLVNVYIGEGHTAADREEWLRDVATRASATSLWVVRAETPGGVLGTVGLASSGPARQVAAEDETEIQLLAVAPGARGQGIGRALVERCLDESRLFGFSRVVLWTKPSNTAAHRLYESMGFRRRPERDQPHPRGGPKLVYSLDL